MNRKICLVIVLAMLGVCTEVAWAYSDASERRFIREGMSESDVLQKIGKPDYKTAAGSDTSTTVRGRPRGKSAGKAGKTSKPGKPGKTSKTGKIGKTGKTGKAGKTWAYRPDPRDPQTLTLVTMAQGKVVRVERKVER